jgi:lipoate-protein ligase A
VTDKTEIEKMILRFFSEHEVHILDVTPMDFVEAFNRALEKIDYLDHGIPLEDVNNVFTVVESINNITDVSVILIPYCAKMPGCEYRQQKGCSKCGKCTVSEVWELAEKKRMTPITILNFEDLIHTLNELKHEGVKAFVGSCCEAFYVKHLEDFQEAGLPGILIDIEDQSCYDLGKGREGKKGEFENQTHLKNELIKQVIDHLRER